MKNRSTMFLDYSNHPFYDTNMLLRAIDVCVYWKQVCFKCLDVELVYF